MLLAASGTAVEVGTQARDGGVSVVAGHFEHPHAPVLIETATRPEEVELLLPQIAEHRELYLTAPRPQVVKDYFDERLRMPVHVPRTAQQVRVQVGYEEAPVPA